MMYSEQVCVVNCASSWLWEKMAGRRMGGDCLTGIWVPPGLWEDRQTGNKTLKIPTTKGRDTVFEINFHIALNPVHLLSSFS